MDNNTTYYNISLLEDYEEYRMAYLGDIYMIILILACFITMLVNLVIILSVFWMKSYATPILKMSISLATADALSSVLYAVGLFGLQIVFFEIIKLMGITVTVAHLLLLSLNHYLGILKPLHYNSIVTERKLKMAITCLWIFPIVIVGGLCMIVSDNKVFTMDGLFSNGTDFLNKYSFRMSYASLFFVPMILMAFCYTHILFIVRQQQKVWKNLSRIGSTKWRGRTVNGCSSTNRMINEQRQMEGNLRAICTTLLILGTCFVGWMPALLIFCLMCDDCLIHGKELDDINNNYAEYIWTVRFIENLLVIMKMLVNAIIYSIRMKEIKESVDKMQLSIQSVFCRTSTDNVNYKRACQRSPVQNSGTSIQIRITSFRNNNGLCSQSHTHPEHNTFL